MKIQTKKKILGCFVLLILVMSIIAVNIWQNNNDRVIATELGNVADTNADKNQMNWNGKCYKRKSYIKAILALGIDSNVDMYYIQDAGSGGQADGIGLIAWDTGSNKLNMIIIPRDTMAEIPVTDVSGDVMGKTMQHITMGFSFGDGNEKSCEFMKESVSNLFGGLYIDQYFAMNTVAIKKINDAVGGVDVIIPYEGMENADSSFVKGAKVHLKGDLAEKFLRYRDTSKDFSAMTRIEAHKVYLEAYQKKLKQFKGKSPIENILEDIDPYCYTDMQKGMILKLCDCAMIDEDFNDDRIYVLEGENKKTELYDEFYVDKDKAMNKIMDLFYSEE